ncbi:hypothetical protein SBADM41S_00777 [Streptomyces badius]
MVVAGGAVGLQAPVEREAVGRVRPVQPSAAHSSRSSAGAQKAMHESCEEQHAEHRWRGRAGMSSLPRSCGSTG